MTEVPSARAFAPFGAVFAFSVMVVVGGATTPTIVRADGCGEGEAEAMELTQRARDEFRAAHYDRSRDLLERALTLCEQPIIVFNLARVSLEGGDLRAASDHYRRYLEMEPEAADRAEVERRLASLEEELQEQERLEREAEEARVRASRASEEAARARARAAEAEGRSQVGPWVVGVSGLVVLGAAVGFAIAAEVEAGVPPELDHLAASEALRRAEVFALVANLGFGVGGAALLAAGIWGLVLLTNGSDEGTQEVRVGLGIGSASFELRF